MYPLKKQRSATFYNCHLLVLYSLCLLQWLTIAYLMYVSSSILSTRGSRGYLVAAPGGHRSQPDRTEVITTERWPTNKQTDDVDNSANRMKRSSMSNNVAENSSGEHFVWLSSYSRISVR